MSVIYVKPRKVKPYLEWVFIFPNSSAKFLRQINALSSGKIDFVYTQFILMNISISFFLKYKTFDWLNSFLWLYTNELFRWRIHTRYNHWKEALNLIHNKTFGKQNFAIKRQRGNFSVLLLWMRKKLWDLKVKLQKNIFGSLQLKAS